MAEDVQATSDSGAGAGDAGISDSAADLAASVGMDIGGADAGGQGAGDAGAADQGGQPGDQGPVLYDFESDPKGLKAIDLEGAKILGKFANVPEVLEALAAAEQSLTPPEQYEIQGELWDNIPTDGRDGFQAWLKNEVKLPAQCVQPLMDGLSRYAMATQEAAGLVTLSEQWGLPADQTRQRRDETIQWAKETCSEDFLKTMVRQGATGFQALHALRTQAWEKPSFKGDASTSAGGDQELKVMYPTMFGGPSIGAPVNQSDLKA